MVVVEGFERRGVCSFVRMVVVVVGSTSVEGVWEPSSNVGLGLLGTRVDPSAAA